MYVEICRDIDVVIQRYRKLCPSHLPVHTQSQAGAQDFTLHLGGSAGVSPDLMGFSVVKKGVFQQGLMIVDIVG
jgi:hypothetical protein